MGATDYLAATHHWGRVRALLRGLPEDREAAELGIAACTQILNVRWRVGTWVDEARALLEVGQRFADAIGDRRAHLKLSMVYARACAGNGDVPEYLQLAAANQRAALELDDVALQANAWSLLTDALGFTCRLADTIRLAEETLARFPDGEELQVERVMMRDAVSHEQAQASLDAQPTRAERLAMADDVLRYSGQPHELRDSVVELHNKYRALAAARPA